MRFFKIKFYKIFIITTDIALSAQSSITDKNGEEVPIECKCGSTNPECFNIDIDMEVDFDEYLEQDCEVTFTITPYKPNYKN